MYYYMLVILLGFTIRLSHAQYEKGAKFGLVEVGFSGNLNSTENPTKSIEGSSTSTYTSLSYKRGAFSKNNFAKGWILGYSLETYKYSNNKYPGSSLLTHNVNVGYFINKFLPLSKSLVSYGQLTSKLGTSFETRDSLRDRNKNYFLQAGLNLGLRYHFKPKWFVNAEIVLINITYRDFVRESDGNLRPFFSYSKATQLEIQSLLNSGYISLSIGKSF
jgi:hypothetical protein